MGFGEIGPCLPQLRLRGRPRLPVGQGGLQRCEQDHAAEKQGPRRDDSLLFHFTRLVSMTAPSSDTSAHSDMAQPGAGSRGPLPVWTVPNQLSAIRLLMSIGVFVLVAWQFYFAALILFVIAASTDWIDGWYARKFNQVTQLGRVLDPFVDKIIICGTYIFLAAEPGSQIVAWMAVVVVGRELLVTALRSFIESGGGDFSARWSGKVKMVFQCFAVSASLGLLSWSNDPPAWLTTATWSLAWLSVLSTVESGIGYVSAAYRSLTP
jgi:CDP-diacylglycerol--glycerol-3-phosphate 3-phosphatidyltransferase